MNAKQRQDNENKLQKRWRDRYVTKEMEAIAQERTIQEVNSAFRRAKKNMSEPKVFANKIYATKLKKDKILSNMKREHDKLETLAHSRLVRPHVPYLGNKAKELENEPKKEVLAVVKPVKEAVTAPVKKAPKANATKQKKIDFLLSEQGQRASMGTTFADRVAIDARRGDTTVNIMRANKLHSEYMNIGLKLFKVNPNFDLIHHVMSYNRALTRDIVSDLPGEIEDLKKQYAEASRNPQKRGSTRPKILQATLYELIATHFKDIKNVDDFNATANRLFEQKRGKLKSLTVEEREMLKKAFYGD